MAETFVFIVLILSFFGMLVIFLKKFPALISLSPKVETSEENLFLKLKSKALKTRPIKSFTLEFFLQKILSRIRVLILKTDNKTSHWLQQLRENSRRKKEMESDNYWEELKNSTNKKKEDLPR